MLNRVLSGMFDWLVIGAALALMLIYASFWLAVVTTFLLGILA